MDARVLNLPAGCPMWGAAERKMEVRAAAAAAASMRQGGCWRMAAGRYESWEFGGALEIRLAAWRRKASFPPAYRFVVVRAAHGDGNKEDPVLGNNDSSFPEEDPEAQSYTGDKLKSDGASMAHPVSDWRDFRANLVAQEVLQMLDTNAAVEASRHLGPKWAHPIPIPETGCVLIATEKLDGVPSFERAVILLLRLGSRDPREGPFGVIINRPQHRNIKHAKLLESSTTAAFAECPLHFGGPLGASMFLLKAGDDDAPAASIERVVPGICFGGWSSLDEAAALVKKGVLELRDFRFFDGYAGWQFDQLSEEIDSGYWVVAACSSHLMVGASAAGLWEEILQLMGGEYIELSRKPKQGEES